MLDVGYLIYSVINSEYLGVKYTKDFLFAELTFDQRKPPKNICSSALRPKEIALCF